MRTIDDLVSECKAFIELKSRNRYERNPSVGKASYLITKNWWKNYKLYVYYDDVRRSNKPKEREEDLHPGTIDNDIWLCENDPKFLIGTGTVE
jgi:hypothetical protein